MSRKQVHGAKGHFYSCSATLKKQVLSVTEGSLACSTNVWKKIVQAY